MSKKCTHIDQIKDVKPNSDGCEDCKKSGDSWIHARVCMVCGHVGCCDSSKNQHARKHFEETGHPIIHSFEPGTDWLWCYEDNEYVNK